MKQCIPLAAFALLLIAFPGLSADKDVDAVKTLQVLGAEVQHAIPFKCSYRFFLDGKYDSTKEMKVLRVWIDVDWKGDKAGLDHLARLPNLYGVSFALGAGKSEWYHHVL